MELTDEDFINNEKFMEEFCLTPVESFEYVPIACHRTFLRDFGEHIDGIMDGQDYVQGLHIDRTEFYTDMVNMFHNFLIKLPEFKQYADKPFFPDCKDGRLADCIIRYCVRYGLLADRVLSICADYFNNYSTDSNSVLKHNENFPFDFEKVKNKAYTCSMLKDIDWEDYTLDEFIKDVQLIVVKVRERFTWCNEGCDVVTEPIRIFYGKHPVSYDTYARFPSNFSMEKSDLSAREWQILACYFRGFDLSAPWVIDHFALTDERVVGDVKGISDRRSVIPYFANGVGASVLAKVTKFERECAEKEIFTVPSYVVRWRCVLVRMFLLFVGKSECMTDKDVFFYATYYPLNEVLQRVCKKVGVSQKADVKVIKVYLHGDGYKACRRYPSQFDASGIALPSADFSVKRFSSFIEASLDLECVKPIMKEQFEDVGYKNSLFVHHLEMYDKH